MNVHLMWLVKSVADGHVSGGWSSLFMNAQIQHNAIFTLGLWFLLGV
jgi:hypothetical protein